MWPLAGFRSRTVVVTCVSPASSAVAGAQRSLSHVLVGRQKPGTGFLDFRISNENVDELPLGFLLLSGRISKCRLVSLAILLSAVAKLGMIAFGSLAAFSGTEPTYQHTKVSTRMSNASNRPDPPVVSSLLESASHL